MAAQLLTWTRIARTSLAMLLFAADSPPRRISETTLTQERLMSNRCLFAILEMEDARREQERVDVGRSFLTSQASHSRLTLLARLCQRH
jgi:hypothetical protein